MKIYKVNDPEFAPYGKVIEGLKVQTILDVLNKDTPLPEATGYVPEEPAIQNLPEAKEISSSLFGGMPVQFGWCNGHNTKLNCLEYHRSSEFNLGTEDFILLLAKEDDIVNGKLDTAKVKAFSVPAGIMVEVYATTLHYAPCHTDAKKGFRVLVALPKGTNTEKPKFNIATFEDQMLFACNKWLIAHEDASEAKNGAYVGLTGKNIDIAE